MITTNISPYCHVGLLFNGDHTIGNYIGGTRVYGYNATVYSNSGNPWNQIAAAWPNYPASVTVDIDLIAGKVLAFARIASSHGQTANYGWEINTFRYTASNVTSITIQGYAGDTNTEISNAFLAGTTARLYGKK